MSISQVNLLASAMAKGLTPDIDDALSMVTPEMFGDQFLRDVYCKIIELKQNDIIIDMWEVSDRLTFQGAREYVHGLVKDATRVNQPIAHAKQIRRQYITQQVSKQLMEMSNKLANNDLSADEISNDLAKIHNSLDFRSSNKEPVSFAQLASGYVDLYERRLKGDNDAIGLDVGLDLRLNRTDFMVIGGTPGMGKTALALYIADYIADQDKKVLMFSLEMEDMQIFEREVSRSSGLHSGFLKDPRSCPVPNGLTFDAAQGKLVESVMAAGEKKIFVDDTSDQSIESVKRIARKFKEKHQDTAMIIVDYLTLLRAPEAQRHDLSIGAITRACKIIAGELKTPVVMLSQMNREAAKMKREPEISDLRDSGAIEQDADKIIFPYRDEVYNHDSPNKGLAKILKRKVRDGEPGEFMLGFTHGNFHKTSAGDWAEREQPSSNGWGS